jgi:hypothetical protein
MAHLEQRTSHALVAMSACDWSDPRTCYDFLRFSESLSLANELLSKYRGSGRRNTLRNQRLGLLWSRRISRQISTHSSQMKTFGPSMSVRTSCWLLLQNEQCSVGSDIGATPARVHPPSRQRGHRLAVRRPRAAAGDASDRISQRWIA